MRSVVARLLAFALLFAGVAVAQNSALNIDDIAPTNSGSPPVGWANPPCFGSGCAGGSGVLVSTTLTQAVTLTGQFDPTLASVAGVFVGQQLVIDTATNQEVVVVNFLAGGISTKIGAVFKKTHASGVSVVSFLQTVDNTAPSIDGESMQLSNYGQAQSNVLWFYNNAPQDGASYFYDDQWLYLDANGSTGNALDVYKRQSFG